MFELGVSLSPRKAPFGPLLFSGELAEGMARVKELGYAGVELSLLDSEKIDQDQLCEQLDRLGLKVFTIATGQSYYVDGCSLFHSDDAKRDLAVERLQGHIRLAARLGAMVILGGIRGRITAQPDQFASILQKGRSACANLGDYAGERGVILLVEPINRYETNVINTVEQGLELIGQIGLGNLKLLPDTFHMNIEERSLEDSLRLAGDKLGYLHLADSNRFAPGMGHLDFKGVLSALREIAYQGPLGVEVLPEPDDLTAARQAINYMRLLMQH